MRRIQCHESRRRPERCPPSSMALSANPVCQVTLFLTVNGAGPRKTRSGKRRELYNPSENETRSIEASEQPQIPCEKEPRPRGIR